MCKPSYICLLWNKCSVLRRQSWDIIRNTKNSCIIESEVERFEHRVFVSEKQGPRTKGIRWRNRFCIIHMFIGLISCLVWNTEAQAGKIGSQRPKSLSTKFDKPYGLKPRCYHRSIFHYDGSLRHTSLENDNRARNDLCPKLCVIARVVRVVISRARTKVRVHTRLISYKVS